MTSENFFLKVSSSLISIKHLPCRLQFGDHLLISKIFLWFIEIPIANDFDRPASASDLSMVDFREFAISVPSANLILSSDIKMVPFTQSKVVGSKFTTLLPSCFAIAGERAHKTLSAVAASSK